MSETRVVNVRHEPCDIYIGRSSQRRSSKAGKWGNPFRLRRGAGMGERKACIAKYLKWVVKQPHLMDALSQLQGKRLGCWCAPKPCHGDVLVSLVASLVK